jgi:hypothetical protein
MPSYYKDGTQYAIHRALSVAHFRVHTMGVHLIRGRLALRDGVVVIDAAGGLRTANFRLDAASMTLESPALGPVRDGLFGGEAHPVIEFETQWARQVGPTHHELDGVLRMHGRAHVFTLRAESGNWVTSDESAVAAPESGILGPPAARIDELSPQAAPTATEASPAPLTRLTPPRTQDEWFHAVVSGTLDRRAWELQAPTLTDAALVLLGHEVHFEVHLYAGPRAPSPK